MSYGPVRFVVKHRMTWLMFFVRLCTIYTTLIYCVYFIGDKILRTTALRLLAALTLRACWALADVAGVYSCAVYYPAVYLFV